MIDSAVDIVRSVNLVLIVLVLVLMALRWRLFLTLQRGLQMLTLGFVALIIATGWATLETLTARVTVPGIRSWIIMLALVWALAALTMLWRDRRH